MKLKNMFQSLAVVAGAWLLAAPAQAQDYPNKPVTIVVTTANLRDWRGRARQFALMDDRRFVALGDWAAVERSGDALVKELVESGAGTFYPPSQI